MKDCKDYFDETSCKVSFVWSQRRGRSCSRTGRTTPCLVKWLPCKKTGPFVFLCEYLLPKVQSNHQDKNQKDYRALSVLSKLTHHSKISGFFSWKKGKRLQSTKSKLNSSSQTTCASVPPTPRSEGEILQSSNLRSFSFSDLKTAPRNFRPDNVLGEGGFGSVFKGWVDENTFKATKPGTGIVIAVNRLNQEGLQGHREWL
ncbi:hypothetical protein MKW98_008553, partial [Papaver atlanticum]